MARVIINKETGELVSEPFIGQGLTAKIHLTDLSGNTLTEEVDVSDKDFARLKKDKEKRIARLRR